MSFSDWLPGNPWSAHKKNGATYQPPPRPGTPHPDEPRGAARGVIDFFRRFTGGWAGPSYSRGSRSDEELRDERVRSGPEGITLPWFLPYFDPSQTQYETDQMRVAYRKMMADPNVKAALLGKILAVSALDLDIIPADKTPRHQLVADFVRWNLTEALTGGLHGLVWSILSGGLVDGYSVNEKVWDIEGRGEWALKYYLRQLKPKDVGHDVVLETDDFRNVVGLRGLRYNPGTIYHPSGFVIYRHLPMYDVPTGISDFRSCYSRWWMLDCVLKLRAVGLEKRSLPILMATYQSSSQRPSLEQSLAKMRSQNWLAIPEGVKVEALNIAGSADSQFADAVKDLKHDIFLGIAGALLQALEGTTTSGRGSSQVHRSTADLFIWHLGRCVEGILNDRHNGLIRDIVDLNFAVEAYPRAVLGAVDVDELRAELAIDEGLSRIGLALSKSDVYGRYGRTPPEDEEDTLAAKGGGEGGPPGSTRTRRHAWPSRHAGGRRRGSTRRGRRQARGRGRGCRPSRGTSRRGCPSTPRAGGKRRSIRGARVGLRRRVVVGPRRRRNRQRSRQRNPPARAVPEAPAAPSSSKGKDASSDEKPAEPESAAVNTSVPDGPALEAGEVTSLSRGAGLNHGTSEFYKVESGGKSWFVKKIKGSLRGRSLSRTEGIRNEVVTEALARLAGVNAPACRAVQFDNSSALASEWLEGESIEDSYDTNKAVIQSDKADVAALALFAFMADQGDRHSGNYFFSGGKVHTIDHEFGFHSAQFKTRQERDTYAADSLAQNGLLGAGFGRGDLVPIPRVVLNRMIDAAPKMEAVLRSQGMNQEADVVAERAETLRGLTTAEHQPLVSTLIHRLRPKVEAPPEVKGDWGDLEAPAEPVKPKWGKLRVDQPKPKPW